MSLLPAFFINGEARKTVVHVNGGVELANTRWGQFAHAYHLYLDSVVRNATHQSPSHTYVLPGGDTMTVTTEGDTDHVLLTVGDKSETSQLETPQKALQGFLVVPMNENKTGPDRAKARLYSFGFDATNFSSGAAAGMYAGNTRKHDGVGKYFTWDGTGGGDMAHEPFDRITSTSGYLQNPNAYAQPYAALSGWVYCDGIGYQLLNGQIHGMRVRGGDMLIADFNGSTVRIHSAKILRKNNSTEVADVKYDRMLGTATVNGKAPVNFSQNMKMCVVGDTIINIEAPFAAQRVFPTQTIPTSDDYKVVRSGYAGNALYLTTRKTTRTGAMSNFSPHDAAEYGPPDSNYGPIDTHGHVEYSYEYFEIAYFTPDNTVSTPAWTGKLIKDNHSTIIKKPVIVFQGIFPTTVFAWLRTVSVTTVEDTNRLYWYKDYDTGDFVRLNWSVGYVSTVQHEDYGIPEPFESAVAVGRGLNVGGYVVEGNNSPSNWLYAVTNSKGDYILRTAPNGQKSDALLVSRTGQTVRVKDTYSVGII
jgi:hypothetical protein